MNMQHARDYELTFLSKEMKDKLCVDRMMILKGALRRKNLNWICVVQDIVNGQLLQRRQTIGLKKKDFINRLLKNGSNTRS